MKKIMFVVLFAFGCEPPPASAPTPAPVVQDNPYSWDKKMAAAEGCKKLCAASGIPIAAFKFEPHGRHTCVCGSAAPAPVQTAQPQPAPQQGPGVVDGLAVGVGMEVGRTVGRAVLEEILE